MTINKQVNSTKVIYWVIWCFAAAWCICIMYIHIKNEAKQPTLKVWNSWHEGQFRGYREPLDFWIDSNGCIIMRLKAIEGHCMFPDDDYMDSDTSVVLKAYCEPYLIDFYNEYKPNESNFRHTK